MRWRQQLCPRWKFTRIKTWMFAVFVLASIPLLVNAALSKDRSKAYLKISETQYQKGEFQESLRTAQKAVELNPDEVYAYDAMGVALEKLGRYDEAIEAFQTALAHISHPIGHYNLGHLYVLTRNRYGANREYVRLRVLDPISAQQLLDEIIKMPWGFRDAIDFVWIWFFPVIGMSICGLLIWLVLKLLKRYGTPHFLRLPRIHVMENFFEWWRQGSLALNSVEQADHRRRNFVDQKEKPRNYRQIYVGSYLLCYVITLLLTVYQRDFNGMRGAFASQLLSLLLLPWRMASVRLLDGLGIAHQGLGWYMSLSTLGAFINASIFWKLFEPWKYESNISASKTANARVGSAVRQKSNKSLILLNLLGILFAGMAAGSPFALLFYALNSTWEINVAVARTITTFSAGIIGLFIIEVLKRKISLATRKSQ